MLNFLRTAVSNETKQNSEYPTLKKGPTGVQTAHERLVHLDLLRGLSALLVMAGHLRAFVFENYGALTPAQNGFVVKIFYLVTGLGSYAVLAFFALSGFLVGGKALNDIFCGRFSWHDYLLKRLTRLWIVIFPALVFTYIFDYIGSLLTGGVGYDGRYYDVFLSGPSLLEKLNHQFVTFLGNLGFVQTIWVPVFGSNGPMWSLANEFWYYVVYPLIAWTLVGSSKFVSRIAGIAFLCFLLGVLPLGLWEGGMVWLAGAGAAWASSQPRFFRLLGHIALRFFAVAVLLAIPVLAKGPFQMSPLQAGFVVAVILPVLALMPSPGRLYTRLARATSEISFTLYLTHFPLLMILVLILLGAQRQVPGLVASAVYSFLIVVAVGWAVLIWWCFERNTDRLHASIRVALYKSKGKTR